MTAYVGWRAVTSAAPGTSAAHGTESAAGVFPADTVETAATTPDHPQPYRELGLKDDEYLRIREILGRRPTDAELAMYSVMWSEHCSYKSSKVHLRYFGETTTDAMKERMLAGIGENAGVVEIGDGWAVTFKVESHNHPSYVEPHQGAATGVGGIVRDIMAMGARPIAVADPLRFGPADAPDTARVLPGWSRASAATATAWGCPTSAARSSSTRPTRAIRWSTPCASERCGWRTCTWRSPPAPATRSSCSGRGPGSTASAGSPCWRPRRSATTTPPSGRKKLPSVQVGDPFTEKVLIECCLELFAAGLVVGIQDLGGAGLSCATSELARAGDGGMHIELDRVPLRATGMTPAEILSSESQERMCAVVTPENVDAFLAVCAKWDTLATVIGEVTDGDRLVITWHGATVVDVPPRTVAHDGPGLRAAGARSEGQDALSRTPGPLPRPAAPSELRAEILRMAASPNLCSRAWVTDQYDRYVRGNTASAQPADAGVVRVDEETGRGIAVATDCNARFVALDPYLGTQLALAEAYRNVATSGAGRRR